MRYETLDVTISPVGPGRLEARASWAFGHGSQTVELDVEDVRGRADALAGVRIQREQAQEIGALLFDRLFRSDGGPVGDQLHQCWGAAKKQRLRGIRLRLRFEDAGVGNVPWELLYWPARDRFLGTTRETALVRYLEAPDRIRNLQVSPPVSLLIVAPTVADLQTATEVDNLTRLLDSLDPVESRVMDGVVTLERLRAALTDRDTHALHFIGHGGVDDAGPFLLLGDGPEAAVDDVQLADLLAEHPALQLVVLNSCQGAQGSVSDPFVGMAQRLVLRGVPAVLAMQYPIFDQPALRFSSELYRSLFAGRDRGDIELATTAARNALVTDFPDTLAFATPALFLRTEDGVLFDLLSGSFREDVPRDPERAHALRSVERTVKRNLELRTQGAEDASGVDRAGDVAADRAALTRIRRRLRTGAVLGGLPTAVAAVVFLASWFYVLDRFTRWARLETLTVRVADALSTTPLDPGLALVAIDARDIEREGEFGPSWRPRIAELVDRVSEAGASVLALDLRFNVETDADSVLAAAFARARARGTVVITAADSFAEGRMLVASALRPHVLLGAACASGGARQVADLLVRKAGTEALTLPSLPLLAATQFRGATLADVDLQRERIVTRGEDGRREHAFTALERIRRDQPGCSLLQEGDTVAQLAVAYSDPGALRDSERRFSFTEVVRSSAVPDQLAGKLVVVGSMSGDTVVPLYPGLGGERRAGFEVMTDAMNTLLQGTEIRPLAAPGVFALILLMAALGALVSVGMRVRPRWQRAVVLMALAIALFLSAVQVYRMAHVMIMVAYPGIALLLGYWGARTLQRWRVS